jgi:hypothetical protein
VLGQGSPGGDAVEAGVAVAPALAVLDPCGDGQAEVADRGAVGGEGDLGVLGQVANDGDVGVGHCCPLPGARDGAARRVGRCGGQDGGLPLSWSRVSRCPAGVGLPAWSATVLASCLLVGPSSSPAPGDRCLRAMPRPGGSRGRPKAGASLHGRERPSTRPAGVWQPEQQANGQDVRGRGAVGVPARQRRRRVEVVPRWQPPLGRCDSISASNRRPVEGRAMPGAEWIWVVVVIAALFAVLMVVLRLARRR